VKAANGLLHPVVIAKAVDVARARDMCNTLAGAGVAAFFDAAIEQTLRDYGLDAGGVELLTAAGDVDLAHDVLRGAVSQG